MHIDYLIVGQGLAGSLLAWELIQRNCKVIIIDNGRENASQVAAGLINPVTGMRFVKSPGVDTFLPSAKSCYLTLEKFFNQTLYLEKSMLRVFQSDQEAVNGQKRLNDPGYQAYLESLSITSNTLKSIVAPSGCIIQKQTGYLLTKRLLASLKAFFIAQNCYRSGDFNYQDVQPELALRWRNVFPKRIIFCEGHHATQNPWFFWLPFQAVKGEILTYQINYELPDKIINYGNWLIPLGAGRIRIGASFDRENLNTLPTQEAKQALLNQFKKLKLDFSEQTLLKHEAGIRPCTLDKQPFIGQHPHYPQLSIFNGFGAKGSLQIPWYSRHFADALVNGTAISKQCDLQRYYATHCTRLT